MVPLAAVGTPGNWGPCDGGADDRMAGGRRESCERAGGGSAGGEMARSRRAGGVKAGSGRAGLVSYDQLALCQRLIP